ncbi:peptide-methionine (S)-S-oxide reductase MsrA [Helicobacter cappadocius]|uniref:Peptide methionine sulfoxide reductase MsrA n=1 Tax=Helicobacter cappadocius TaxID=3063998 RepID=A0AA90SSL4_9HELI|nr:MULTISPECIES: peptide-methionine (S)-S-oxide reductase MsrA [unclassified Helicobacter]MDO7252966.1 peptide-methionine (S)-S-oxide reductase MsrA [Helicobacter sp. faydin-H75]MDP2539044.1 peptide-methionine (S)-S-oxide reductase MsrA [Helicobacter sp. faydin-H76]
MKSIYLAGGCFWGVQGYFDLLEGVKKTSVGYANSNIINPSYELVCSGKSGAVEALELFYDEEILSLEEILKRFFSIINPTSINRQGNDIGTQYRSGIYTQNLDTLQRCKDFVQKLQPLYNKPIQTEIKELKNYYLAEEYHQKYLQKNPRGYCHIDLSLAQKPIPSSS